MSDANRELIELRKEVVEARNQAIKTDNNVKNLSLDVKGFEKRFDALERRAKLSSVGVYAIVAVTIAVATYMVHSVRVKSLTGDLQNRITEAENQQKAAEKLFEQAKGKVAQAEQDKQKREKAAVNALKLVEHLDAKRDKEAVDLLEVVDLTSLTTLEQRLLDKRVGELRTTAAETAYKAGRAAADQKRGDVAVAQLRRALALDPQARYANSARYILGTWLWTLKRHEEAEPVFRDLMKAESDRAVLDEIRYLLATSLVAQKKIDEARVVLTEVVQRGGRFGSYARSQLDELDKQGGAALAAAEVPPAPPRVEAPKPEAPKPEAPKPEPVKTELAKPELARPKLPGPKPAATGTTTP